MEYTICAKISKKEDTWGIIGLCLILKGTHIPEGAILHIWGKGSVLKAFRVLKKEPKRRHRGLYRFVGLTRSRLYTNMPEIPVIRVVPLHLE